MVIQCYAMDDHIILWHKRACGASADKELPQNFVYIRRSTHTGSLLNLSGILTGLHLGVDATGAPVGSIRLSLFARPDAPFSLHSSPVQFGRIFNEFF